MGRSETVDVSYGSGHVTLDFPVGSLAGVVSEAAVTGGDAGGQPAGEAVAAALGRLLEQGHLAGLAGRRLLVLLEDGTRAVDHGAMAAAVASALGSECRLSFVLCTGTHDPLLPENIAARESVAAAAGGAEVWLHDARDDASLGSVLGTTSHGNAVRASVLSEKADAFLVLSDMKNHYFAGYSNPVKNFVPGLAALETVERNHAFAMRDEATFGRHPLHPDPTRRGNPVANDQWEAAQMVIGDRPCLAIAMTSHARIVTWWEAGPLVEAAAAGIARVDASSSVSVEPVEALVVSPGGWPHDESLYSAQRALELTKAALRAGGEALFLTECRNGIGPPKAVKNFFEPLQRPLEESLAETEADYRMYSHKAHKFARYLVDKGPIHTHSLLDPVDVATAHLAPAPDPQAVVDRWAAEGRAMRVFDDASKFAVYSI